MRLKFLSILLVSFLIGLAVSCKSDETPTIIEEDSSIMDIETAPKSLISLEALPNWLQKDFEAYFGEATLWGYYNAFMGELEGQIIYYIDHGWKNCICDHR